MRGPGRWIAGCAMALSLSGCCTLAGTAVGGVIASGKNSDPDVQAGTKHRASVGAWMGLGAGIGLLLDIGLVAIAISQDEGSFGH